MLQTTQICTQWHILSALRIATLKGGEEDPQSGVTCGRLVEVSSVLNNYATLFGGNPSPTTQSICYRVSDRIPRD